MLHHAGAVKLIDFGIVRSALQTHKTRTGVVKGKFSYLAPEALERGRAVDHRADLFGLGVVLHESLTGRSLFRGRDDVETMRRLKSGEIPNVKNARPDVPVAFAEVISTALRRDPETRFQSATEFLVALERAAEHAGLPTSITALRREVTALCGQPAWPLATPGDTPTAPGPGNGSKGPSTADSRLAYFLGRSVRNGAAEAAKPVPTREPTKMVEEQDIEFEEFLSHLDR
jgi:serine/threonine-protein kinase